MGPILAGVLKQVSSGIKKNEPDLLNIQILSWVVNCTITANSLRHNNSNAWDMA